MVIGIDLRPLQTGHKYRGIGEVVKQVTNHILKYSQTTREDKQSVSFVFYEYDIDTKEDDPKLLLSLPKNISYSEVFVGKDPESGLPRTKQEKLASSYAALYGSPIKESAKSDVFLQFAYEFGIPKDTKTVLIIHDFIPDIFWNNYFESAWVPFKNRAMRTTLRTLYANYKHSRLMRRALKDADKIVAVSESTKKDAISLYGIDPKKITVAHLGVDTKPTKTTQTSKMAMPTKPYLLFIGAGDARRRVEDLVSVYNNLKAKDIDVQLVLVGENFKKPTDIPNETVRNAVLKSSYKKDILTMGYVDDATKQALYKGAIAYVYPTRYEGFGIPVLEAMLFNCPIIAYKNSSIPEVGGNHVLYADDWQGVVKNVHSLLEQSDAERTKETAAAKKHAEKFTWEKTAKKIYEEILHL